MIAVDTNVLVRYLVDDDPDQSARAAAFVERLLERDDRIFVSRIVLCEVVWVLTRGYGFSRPEVVRALRGLLKARQVVVEELDAVRRSLDAYAGGSADFADYAILECARSAGCTRFTTFDAQLLGQPEAFSP